MTTTRELGHERPERLPFDLRVGRAPARAAVEGGRYTGDLDRPFCYGGCKLEALRLALGDIDLRGAFAYADSASDLPLLRACGHPVAVNPDRTLRRVAGRFGWPVLVLG